MEIRTAVRNEWRSLTEPHRIVLEVMPTLCSWGLDPSGGSPMLHGSCSACSGIWDSSGAFPSLAEALPTPIAMLVWTEGRGSRERAVQCGAGTVWDSHEVLASSRVCRQSAGMP